jgi:predicted amidohydrolase
MSPASRRPVKVAAIQLDVDYGNVEGCVAKVCSWMERAAKDKVDIALFPELILSSVYCGLSTKELGYKYAEPVPGPSLNRVCQKAKELNMHVIVGIAERGKLGSVYDSTVLVDSEGSIVGVYRKTHLYPPTEYVFTYGTTIPTFHTRLAKIGMLICYDLEFPETARILALGGAEIIFHAVANWPQSVPSPPNRIYETSFAARAVENRIPIVIANRVGYDPDLKSSFIGLSRIIDPFGEILAVASRDKEEIIMADMDLEEIKRRKSALAHDIFRDRRPHLYGKIAEPHQS